MRIPSQFNDSSLYRPRRGDAKGQKYASAPGSAGSKRRLIRLAVALLLVIVVMREAGKPGLYQTFFGAREDQLVAVQGTSPRMTKTQSTEQPSAASEAAIHRDAASPAVASRSVDWSSVAIWVQAMPIELQRGWAETLVRLKSNSDSVPGRAITWSGVTDDQIAISIKTLIAQADQHRSEVRAQILQDCEWLQLSARAGSADATAWMTIAPWASAMLDAIEMIFVQRVSDGTFWLGGDRDAFYLALAQGSDLDMETGVTTGTLPLLQQPDVYRGQSIRIAGRLQLAEKKTAQDNPLGIVTYWTLWIIPDDGGVRPSILITAKLPEVLERSLNADGSWDRKTNTANPEGQLIAIGRFIKRLPYRSSIGADLAPVMIGRVVAAKGVAMAGSQNHDPASSADSATVASRIETDAIRSGQGILGILLAIAAGITLASVVMYRSAADAKRTRRLRNQTSDRVLISIDRDGQDGGHGFGHEDTETTEQPR